MNADASKLHICDDWISCTLVDLQTVHEATRAAQKSEIWNEVVPGIDSLAVQFDPARMLPDEAAALLQSQLARVEPVSASTIRPMVIPVCYDPQFGPDQPLVADKLGIAPTKIPAWHAKLQFKVTMLGFMPGFAYLACDENVQDIGRLAQPRQRVAPGSVGIIGDQSCVYSFESPGGWPIIGRTPLALFTAGDDQPALLSAGQHVVFSAISRDEFESVAGDQ